MFPNAIQTGLKLPKILNGLQKTLNIANQIIPIYVQVKPLIKNAQSAFSVAKEIMSTPAANTNNNSKKVVKEIPTKEKKEEVSSVTNLNNPVFFL